LSALKAVALKLGFGSQLGVTLGAHFGFKAAFCANVRFAGTDRAMEVDGAEGACAGWVERGAALQAFVSMN
jgi:hypothetical protein